MSNSSGIYWGFNEFGNINRTSLNDYAPWPLWEQILGIVYYFSISVIGILGRSVLIILLQGIVRGEPPPPPFVTFRRNLLKFGPKSHTSRQDEIARAIIL